MKKERDFDFGQGEEDVAETPVKTEPEETEVSSGRRAQKALHGEAVDGWSMTALDPAMGRQ